jgi:phosphomethylpyrimidine synthase
MKPELIPAHKKLHNKGRNMNIFQKARNGTVTPEVELVARNENQTVDFIMEHFSAGRIAVFKNSSRNIAPVAVGTGCTTKINANIGTSPDLFDLDTELRKLNTAIKFGADAVMDLSVGGDVTFFRRKILESSTVPLGTVPLYEVVKEVTDRKKSIMDFTIGDYLRVVERQAREGVDFMTIHSGVTLKSLESLHSQERIVGITSRGGSILGEWIKHNKKENPLYEYYDEILDILAEYNIVISLGDGLRPGATHDASDRGQLHEMVILGELARRARERGVQAIIEGPGHVPLNMIADNMRLEKSLCDGSPLLCTGAACHGHCPWLRPYTGAIGGAIAASNGADFLCYVTPAEHLKLPSVMR